MTERKNCLVCKICCTLVLVGALNWGLVGAFNFNLVEALLGSGSLLTRIVYILVGLSAILSVVAAKKCPCKKGSCGPGGEQQPPSQPGS